MAKHIDLSILSGATNHAKYPSEMHDNVDFEVIGNVIKNVPGTELKGKRIKIDPKKTTLFPDNPRNFAPKDDLADLLPLIKKTGGNSTAVDGRIIQGSVEIIAGSRRRDACLLTDLPLIVDLWDDVNDELACSIAEIENSGRKDPDVIADCCYLLHRYNKLKKVDSTLNVEKFAAMYHNQRRNMMTLFGIARMPEWVRNCATVRSEWTIRQADTLRKYFETVRTEHDEDEIKTKLNFPVKLPSQALALFKSLAHAPEDEKLEVKPSYKLKVGREGEITLRIHKELTEEQKSMLDEFLKNL